MTNEEESLVVEEYKSLRELILENIRIMERNEIYAIGAIAASAAYDLKLRPALLLGLFAWMPTLIGVLGAYRFYALDKTISTINSYLALIERRYPKLGYVTFYFSDAPASQHLSTSTTLVPKHGLKRSREVLWWCLIAFGIVFGLIMDHGSALGLLDN